MKVYILFDGEGITGIVSHPLQVMPDSPGFSEMRALLMVGYHSMAETAGGLLPHTYTLDMKELRLNGVLMGEIGLEAALAGSVGVPLVMVSGDDMAMKEAEALLGDFEGASVKYAVSESGALCLPPTASRALIREKAVSALGELPFGIHRVTSGGLRSFD
jgi:D-amino peptidase